VNNNFYINLSEFDDCKKIELCVKEINKELIEPKDFITNNEVNAEVEIKMNNLLHSFNDIERAGLGEVVKSINGFKYNKDIINILGMNQKIKIINYIYWQYKSKKIKFKLNDIKKILIMGKEKYTETLEVKKQCNICGGNGTMYFEEYGNNNNSVFKCSKCGHSIRKREYVFPIGCNCEECLKLENKLYCIIKNNLNNLLNSIEERIMMYSNEIMLEKAPSDEIMRRDWILYKGSMNKDIRELLSYKPKDLGDIDIIIEEIKKRKKIYNNTYRTDIYNNLHKFKIIYKDENLKQIYKDNIIETCFNHFIINRNGGKQLIGRIRDIIKNCNDLQDLKKEVLVYKCQQVISINFTRLGCDLHLPYSGSYRGNFNSSIETSDVINKYFFLYDTEIVEGTKSDSVNKIFNSGVEESYFIDYRSKYQRNILLPNYRVVDIIDLESFKDVLDKDEYAYIKNGASFNLVIADLEGIPLKVVQISRGEHHNDEEWIWKDNVKRKICKLAGLEFKEEY
jgi:hypothetical protein